MVTVIPTWLVSVTDGETWRVPQTNLEAFIHILIFNGKEFKVRREPKADYVIKSSGSSLVNQAIDPRTGRMVAQTVCAPSLHLGEETNVDTE